MKEPDEAARPCSTDENCVSSLIGTVLTLIISILVWLQKIGCKNTGNADDCQNACDFNQALEQLTLIAQQTDTYGKVDTRSGAFSSSSKRLKDDSKKNLKRNKSGENHAVLYAVGEDEIWGQDCKKCCKKVVEPKENKDNVIFEVVAAQMVENEMQTDIKTFVDNFTQPDESFSEDKDTDTEVPCPCPMSTQVSKQSVDPPSKPETEEKDIQVEIITSSKDITCECETLEKETSVRFEKDNDEIVRTSAYVDEDEDEEYDEEDDEDDYNDGEPEYLMCPDGCVPFAQRSQSPIYRQSQYLKGQGQVQQDRQQFYQGYEAPQMYKQYSPRYTPRDQYSPMPYQYPRQPYYQKVTRTIQRGPARSADYQNVPQRQKSPTQRTSLYQEGDADFKGVDKVSQSEQTPAPQPTPIKPMPQARVSKTETPPQQQPMFKECVPNCPGTKMGVRKVSAVLAAPPTPAPMQRTAAIEKPEPPANQKKCLARCAKSPHNSNTSNQPKTSTSKEKSRSVALMPKGAIPIEVNAVLETEKPTGKPDIVASVVMSVEASKQAK